MSTLGETFIAEAKEILSGLESDIVRLEEKFDSELINNIFRYVHTLKGSSGVAGFRNIYEYTHKLEDLMERIRSGKLGADSRITDLLLESLDWIRFDINKENDEKKEEKADAAMRSLLSRIEEFNGETEKSGDGLSPGQETGKTGSETTTSYFRIQASFKENIFESGIDPLILLEELESIGELIAVSIKKEKLPPIEKLDPQKCYLGWDLVLRTEESEKDVGDLFLFVVDKNNIVIEDITAGFLPTGKGEEMKEKKLGEILVEKGIISEEDLEDLIDTQETRNIKLGDMIVKKGLAEKEEVESALDDQVKIKKHLDTETVRVDTGKLDKLMNLLGEIVIGQASLSGVADDLIGESRERLKSAMYNFDRITREFQEQLMSIRMIPIGPTFEQFMRFVRDASRSVGKEISIAIEGGETELEKRVIEKIHDPLKHMIRNAIDHGIESVNERMRIGKKRKGKITLKAYHQEGSVYIEVIDDGKGIDIEGIREKAVAMNLIKAEEQVSEQKLLSFLFAPGFSTAGSVGELSGRGVGMDVVKTNIESLRGTVDIETEPGTGTAIKIKLPLTLAIIDGMQVRVGAEKYIIPLLSIIESFRPTMKDVKTVEGKGEVVSFRGEYLSLIRVSKLFGIEPEFKDPWDSIVMVAESNGRKVGLHLDELLGQYQIVIKSIDNEVTRSKSISGAAILGDGSIALILDIHGIIRDIK